MNELVIAGVYVLGGLVAAVLARYILNNYLSRLFRKTRSNLDDRLFRIVSRPVFYYIIILGLYLGLKTLSQLSRYEELIDGVFMAVTVLAVTSMINRILRLLIDRWMAVKAGLEKTPNLIKNIVTAIVYVVAFILILDNFGVKITPILATLGVGGLAIGLALKDTLSNIFSGLYILSDRPVNVGDYVELQDGKIAGFVEDIGWRTAKIRTRRNDMVIIPNTQLAESVITNYYLMERESAFLVNCGVAYTSDLAKVEKVTLQVAGQIQTDLPEAVDKFEPVLRFQEFGQSNINFIVVLRAKQYIDKGLITHEFIKALKARYDQEGIEISWPVRKIVK